MRQAEELMQGRSTKGAATKRVVPDKDASTLDLEKRLADALGLGVAISHGERGGKWKSAIRPSNSSMTCVGRSAFLPELSIG